MEAAATRLQSDVHEPEHDTIRRGDRLRRPSFLAGPAARNPEMSVRESRSDEHALALYLHQHRPRTAHPPRLLALTP